ncbi:MAG TPA: enediyne biosynthesis protein UnbU [Kofleriaceae bacterium]|jgi:Na+-transporting NADH:ubiquinone oxidoreductase subunit NqrB|nr:enediyne biosynthesis protein UnbU [Kofleriaceae bacterium]
MKDLRLAALRRFAVAISVLNLVGHTVLGFEQSYVHVAIALATAYAVELGLEVIDARACRRALAFRGGALRLVDFLLPAHITALACSMLLYPNERLGPILFAAAFGVASKSVFRARITGGRRHFLNPSNAGIAATLLAFPWVGVAMPYQFTENLHGAADWILPLLFVGVGSLLNARFTRRIPLIAGWVGGFVLQAAVRSAAFDVRFLPALVPMTGVAFVLFTFYMVPDPGTTPARPRDQVAFGAAVAAVYSALQVVHVVYGLFFALAIVCSVRGLALWARAAVTALRARLTALDVEVAATSSIEGGT